MAHRLITQAALTAARVFGRAFAEAYRQANASSAYRKTASSSSFSSTSTSTYSGLTLDEACRILNISSPKGHLQRDAQFLKGEKAEAAKAEYERYTGQLSERFKKLFDTNEPGKGGSFYLQSKVLRARERVEGEIGKGVEEMTETRREDLPKVYRQR